MYVDYLLYLNLVSKEKESKQVMIMLLIFIGMLLIAIILRILKNKYIYKIKNKKLRKFLDKF